MLELAIECGADECVSTEESHEFLKDEAALAKYLQDKKLTADLTEQSEIPAADPAAAAPSPAEKKSYSLTTRRPLPVFYGA